MITRGSRSKLAGAVGWAYLEDIGYDARPGLHLPYGGSYLLDVLRANQRKRRAAEASTRIDRAPRFRTTLNRFAPARRTASSPPPEPHDQWRAEGRSRRCSRCARR